MAYSGSNNNAGTAYMTINGLSYMLAGKFKYSVNSFKNETQLGMDSVHGYKQTYVAPFISGQLRDARGLTVADFNAMDNVTIVVELANGKTIIGSGMWIVDTQEVDSEDAVFDVKWEGMTDSVTEN